MTMDMGQVIDRMREIEDALPDDDGVAVFNRMYLTVTERIAAALADPDSFEDDDFMTVLSVRFAQHYLDAYDASDEQRPRAWAPLFEGRDRRRVLPVQFALSGMNTHIEHDLPLAVTSSCEVMGMSPRDDVVQRDYDAINRILAEAETDVRRSFLNDFAIRVDDEIGPVVHLLSSWSIDRARDVAWSTIETLWLLREVELLSRAFRESLALTVGMGSRLLLTPAALFD